MSNFFEKRRSVGCWASIVVLQHSVRMDKRTVHSITMTLISLIYYPVCCVQVWIDGPVPEIHQQLLREIKRARH